MDDTHMNSAGPQTLDEVDVTCSVCAHPRAAHDAIAARFCDATVAGRHDRGCVCSILPTSKPSK